jgi:predicted nucleotidyltransferase
MNRLPSHVADVITQLKQGLQGLYGDRFRDLLLFGSYARGEADEGSDVDLLLLLDGPVQTSREIVKTSAVSWPLALAHDLVLSVIPVSLQVYQQGGTPFYRNVHREAVPAA